jgi:hypothetical protein
MSSIDLQPEEVSENMEVWFFLKPKDSVPHLRTTVTGLDEDSRGRVSILGKGIPEWYPIYHFRKANPEIEKYGCLITDPLDDLQVRLGI